jgi:hypothetical protein
MKRWALLAAVAATGLSGGAFAQACPGSGYVTSAFINFAGKTVCVGNSPNWAAQETHIAPNVLKDYKKGPTDQVDPTTTIGTWSMDGQKVKYNYGSTTYTYKAYVTEKPVHNGTGIIFCPVPPNSGGTQTTGTLRTTTGPC